ncbi:hypothetical protein GDO78_006575 [Eleutherodactylus coqui]|uniref:Uncharacterized protein n=1 Tax=Eleutherodactylus coqui TaxID=57060 RepID=A0A8J6KGF7_ELECQ|nr:hypothetical protein GDO78_006575 [Eleutherodactylus coqui]
MWISKPSGCYSDKESFIFHIIFHCYLTDWRLREFPAITALTYHAIMKRLPHGGAVWTDIVGSPGKVSSH